MKYYIRNDTLFVRGTFSAASTGPCGGLRPVSTVLLYSTEKPRTTHGDPCRDVTLQVAREGLPNDFFGIHEGNGISRLCIVQYDFITVFILAATSSDTQADQVTIVVYSGEGLAENALLQMIITVSSAKARALTDAGLPAPAASDDHVIVASETEAHHKDAGRHSEAGWRVSECILFGLPHALEQKDRRKDPALYVYSRLGGGHFVLWRPRECPYYPCHFQGQRCDYCYCPFYPLG
ncbi:MAG: adenosylcobinamide amidohydrolase [Methanomicrobiales archaeon]|nr:adenosylcobinamide amidohydrolase [Methanomicrobiales archaeon]